MKAEIVYLCSSVVLVFSLCSLLVLLYQPYNREALADTDYPCLPIPPEQPCLQPQSDMANVTSMVVDNTLGTNLVGINSTITTYYEMNSSAIYILQITNDNDGTTEYISWKPFAANKTELSTYFFEQIALDQGSYSAKIMIWTEIDERFYPLILQPATRNSIIIA
ncbi:MAG TPA: hypothetical protein VF172_00045 [Nitrososphaera sp.]|jgi:hypothetical protein